MLSARGIIVLMGSGELTSTMVEVHKDLIARQGNAARAFFLDTPAGFQLNVDQISQRAVDYFRLRVGREMGIASFKSRDKTPPGDAEQAFGKLRGADYILIGPGSPTYAVRQFASCPIPEILTQRVAAGACIVAASAAALTVGRCTLPVYEIYKVGETPHWVEGIDLLARFGFDLAVVPHWNNAEGGTHDTRFCFMGEPNFRRLESLLPEETAVLGLDEHTACILDLGKALAEIRGIGQVVLRRRGRESVFRSGDAIPLAVLRGVGDASSAKPEPSAQRPPALPVDASDPSLPMAKESFWELVHGLEGRFHDALAQNVPGMAIHALLELDRAIWSAHQDLESGEIISQAREVLRELIVLLGTRFAATPRDTAGCLAPVVEEILALRRRLRGERQWMAADAIRDSLQRANIFVEDTGQGARWHYNAPAAAPESGSR